MFKTIFFWLKAARLHTLPMSLLSLLVIFCWCLKLGGNITYGIIASIGVMLAHLGVNLIDDFFDYQKEVKTITGTDFEKANKMHKGKCKYLTDGKATIKQLGIAILIFFGIAAFIGLFMLIKCGWQVAAIAAFAGIFCVSYPFLTYLGLGEIAVGMTFAPLLFAGISFVMLGYTSIPAIILSISTGMLTVGLLHTHALMDFDSDIKDNKKTLCTILGTKNKALWALALMMLVAYLNIIFGVLYGIFPKLFLITLITIPLAIALVKFMKLGIDSPEIVPERKLWMGPMDNWDEIVKNNAQNFMLKFYISRNIMMFFSILLCLGILFS